MKKKSETFNSDRLTKLAHHLIHGPIHIPMESIETAQYMIELDGKIEIVIPFYLSPFQEIPFVFPGEWRFSFEGDAYWIGDRKRETISSAIKFFGLNNMMIEHLLFPNRQHIDLFGGNVLSNNALSEDVGYNMLALVKSINAIMNNIQPLDKNNKISKISKS